MEDFLEGFFIHAEVERTELAGDIIRRKELDFRRRIVRDSLQITLGCIGGNFLCGER
jgi:hypothetical protein